MYFYKSKFNYHDRYLPENMDLDALIEEWPIAMKSGEYSKLIRILDPLLETWGRLLRGDRILRSGSDWVSFCMSVENQGTSIDEYLYYLETYTNSWRFLKEELQFALYAACDGLKKRAHKYNYKKGSKLYYLFNLFLRKKLLLLFQIDKLKKYTYKFNHRIYEPDSYEDLHPDYLAIKNLELTAFENYLCTYYLQDYELNQIKQFSLIDRERYYSTNQRLIKKLKRKLNESK